MTGPEQLAALKELYASARALAEKATALEPLLPAGTDLSDFAAAVTDAAGDYLPWRLIKALEDEAAAEAERQTNSDRIAYRR